MSRRISVLPNDKKSLIDSIVYYQVELIRLEVLTGNREKEADLNYISEFRNRLNGLNIKNLQKYYELVKSAYNEKYDKYHKEMIKLENEAYDQIVNDYLLSLGSDYEELVGNNDNLVPVYYTGNIPIEFPIKPNFHPYGYREDSVRILK